MQYQSTRSLEQRGAADAILHGLASDGGLYTPMDFRGLVPDWKELLSLSPIELSARLLEALFPDLGPMSSLAEDAYRNKFDVPELTPLVSFPDMHILELFHGPTSAFKDVALSVLPHLFTRSAKLSAEKGTAVVLTATSGDTGKAALEGFHNVEGTKIFVFYPDGGVSPIQRLQMVTQEGANTCVCAVRGNFDDCQRGVKNAFAKLNGAMALSASGYYLSSANSINLGRLVPQISYYFSSYAQLLRTGRITLGDKVDYVVPTGNFGDILAGYFAKRLGLPIGRLICASNQNNVLTDFFGTGLYDANRHFYRTSSPSMDILISSNMERMLYYVCEGDCSRVKELMDSLAQSGCYQLAPEELTKLQDSFCAYYTDENETATCIRDFFEEYHYLPDPHTAVALSAAERYRALHTENELVVLSTASPYKFPGPVLNALGVTPPKDDFDKITLLEEISKMPAPDALKALKDKPVLHEDVIDRDEIIPYICRKLEVNI